MEDGAAKTTIGNAGAYRAAIERWENEGGRPLAVEETDDVVGGAELDEDHDAGHDEHQRLPRFQRRAP